MTYSGRKISWECFDLILSYKHYLLNENLDIQVNDKGQINLGGLLKLTAGYGEIGMPRLNMC